MNRQSIKIRFFSSVVGNILQIGLLFVTGVFIARGLKPADYGNFIFLMGSFAAIAELVGMSSSSAFYTFISQAKRGIKFYSYYCAWLIIQFMVLFLLVLLLPDTLKQKVWLGHSKYLILLALFASFSSNQMWKFSRQVGESLRDTTNVHIQNTLLLVTYLIFVILLVALNLVSVKGVLAVKGGIYIFFVLGYVGWLWRKASFYTEKEERLADLLIEFKNYCSPLIIFTVFSFFYTFSDYWFLQKFGGAVQQAYYGIGARIASVSMIATTSILQIFWKEIAEANAQGNMQRVRMLYHKISKSLYFIGATISCFLIPFSSEILSAVLGSPYRAAWLSFSIMLLYPVHQSLGQITGTMLMATGQTKTKSMVGIVTIVGSIVAAYFVLAPSSFFIPGLSLGAKGLALKMVICQLIEVNVMAFLVAKYIKTSFNWIYQINILLLLLLVGFMAKICTRWVLSAITFPSRPVLLVFISGILYSGAVAVLLYKLPSIAGIDRAQIDNGLVWLRRQVAMAQ